MARLHLSVDTFTLVLDYVAFPCLLRAAHVCRSWRSIALDHPTYWRDIRLHSASPSALDCFSARITSRQQGPLVLDIKLSGLSGSERGQVLQNVFPAMRASIHRWRSVSIHLHQTLSFPLFSHLHEPAPCLEILALSIELLSSAVDTLPCLFQGECPQHHTLKFYNLLLPSDLTPMLYHVEHIVYRHMRMRSVDFPVALLLKSGCNAPPLRSIELSANGLELPRTHAVAEMEESFRTLRSMSLFARNDIDLVSTLPLHLIPELRLWPLDLNRRRRMLYHLDSGALHLRIDASSNNSIHEDTLVTYASTSAAPPFDVTTKQRSFPEECSDFFSEGRGRGDLAGLYFNPTYLERIVSLTVSLSRWGILVHHSPRFPNCRTLTVTVNYLQFGDPFSRVPVAADSPGPGLPSLTELKLERAPVEPCHWQLEHEFFVALSGHIRGLSLRIHEVPESCRLVLCDVHDSIVDPVWASRFK
ncbi:hypothetical protein EXIGLDRAFT_733603 [Exidia glandulosa HHB12029]|uniref:F-box domain-containing protein n=1 Tax=Exidia glandulosa HHB12029 TaxID=1314781 RepID=A0A165KF52_EXIGL|nr:hypothetical protein EXIGLDRAFT_733603 [Exidia glandulosa HHB12029]